MCFLRVLPYRNETQVTTVGILVLLLLLYTFFFKIKLRTLVNRAAQKPFGKYCHNNFKHCSCIAQVTIMPTTHFKNNNYMNVNSASGITLKHMVRDVKHKSRHAHAHTQYLVLLSLSPCLLQFLLFLKLLCDASLSH